MMRPTRAGGAQLDPDGDKQHQGGGRQQDQGCQQPVFNDFDPAFRPGKRGLHQVDDGKSRHLADGMIEQLDAVNVGYKSNMNRQAAQVCHQRSDLLVVMQRQGDPHLIYAQLGHISGETVQAAAHRHALECLPLQARIIVVKTGHFQTGPRRGCQAARHVTPQVSGAGYRDKAQIESLAAQEAQPAAQQHAKNDQANKARHRPLADPQAGKIRAGLGGKQRHDQTGKHHNPGTRQHLRFRPQAGTAVGAIKIKKGKNCQAEQKTTRQKESVVSGKIQITELERIKHRTAAGHQQGIHEALEPFQQTAMLLEQAARIHGFALAPDELCAVSRAKKLVDLSCG